MLRCRKCNAELNSAAGFCPVCGATLTEVGVYDDAATAPAQPTDSAGTYQAPIQNYQQSVPQPENYQTAPQNGYTYAFSPEPPRIKSKKVLWFILIPVILLLAAGITLYAIFIPARTITQAAFNTFDKISDQYTDFSDILSEAEEKGMSLKAEINLPKSDDIGLDEAVGITVAGNALPEKDSLNASVTLTVGDEKPVSASGVITENDIAVMSEQLLGDTAYGTTLKDIKEKLTSSIFAPDSGSDYAMDQEAFDRIIDMLSAEDKSENYKDIKKNYRKFIGKLAECVADNAKAEKSRVKVDVGDATVNAKEIKYTITEVEEEKIILALVELVKNDKTTREFLEDVYEMQLYQALMGTDDLDSFEDFCDILIENLSSAAEQASDESFEVVLTGYIYRNCLVRLDLESDGVEFVIMLGKNPAKAQKQSIEMKNGGESYSSTTKITLDVSENTKSSLKMEIKTNSTTSYEESDYMDAQTYESENLLKFEWDKKSGDAVFSLESDEYSFTADMNLKIDKKKSASFEMSKISMDFADESTADVEYEFTLKLDINTSPEAKDMPEYTDILTFDDEKMKELIEKLEKNLEEFVSSSVVTDLLDGDNL